jgi:hypothetical protein
MEEGHSRANIGSGFQVAKMKNCGRSGIFYNLSTL